MGQFFPSYSGFWVNTIEEQKQMLKHLHRRVQDHLRERHDLIEMNEECEKVIKEKENKIKDVSNYHKKAREEYKDALATWEKKKDISNKLMKTLQNENATLKNRLEENSSSNFSEVLMFLLYQCLSNCYMSHNWPISTV